MNFVFICCTVTKDHSIPIQSVKLEDITCPRMDTNVIFECLTNDDVFDDFPKISDHFSMISEDFLKLFRMRDERFRTISEQFSNISSYFRTFSEDHRRQSKKIRRCFDHTLTNLSVVKGPKEKCFQKGMICSQCEG